MEEDAGNLLLFRREWAHDRAHIPGQYKSLPIECEASRVSLRHTPLGSAMMIGRQVVQRSRSQVSSVMFVF